MELQLGTKLKSTGSASLHNTLVRSHDRLVQFQVAASTFGTVAMETAALPACCLSVCWEQGCNNRFKNKKGKLNQ